MNEEGDVPTVSETDKPQQEPTDSRKTTQSTRLIRRLGSLTGITKSKAKGTTESTEEIVALQIKVSQLTKELEESRSEIDRCKRESGDVTERLTRESDEIRSEFDRYKLESQFEKKSLMTKMENDDKLKSAEMEMLKIAHLKTEAEKDSLISKMECEVKLKSSEIENLKIANLKTEAERETLITKMECEAKILKRELEDAKRESDNLKEKLESNRVEIDRYKVAHLTAETERDSLFTKMECGAKLTSAEMDNLKKESHEKASFFSMLESEVKLKSAEIENLKIAHLKAEGVSTSRISQLEGQVKLKSAAIENLKTARDESTAAFKDVITLKNAKIRQLEAHLAKTCAESSVSQNAGFELESMISQLGNEVKSRFVRIEESLKASLDVRSGLEKVEKNLSSLINRTTKMTIRARFVVSKLTNQSTYSKWTEFAGMNWRIFLYKNDDHLAFSLQRMDANYEACSAFFEFKLISQKSEQIAHCKNPKVICVFDEKSPNWGYIQFISFKDLFDEEKGYVKDDSIIVAVVIEAFPPN